MKANAVKFGVFMRTSIGNLTAYFLCDINFGMTTENRHDFPIGEPIPPSCPTFLDEQLEALRKVGGVILILDSRSIYELRSHGLSLPPYSPYFGDYFFERMSSKASQVAVIPSEIPIPSSIGLSYARMEELEALRKKGLRKELVGVEIDRGYVPEWIQINRMYPIRGRGLMLVTLSRDRKGRRLTVGNSTGEGLDIRALDAESMLGKGIPNVGIAFIIRPRRIEPQG